ncbi:MAG TPA: HIT domain-containing protein [Candidatus Eisenbacteria bacterium]|nr:HIT domain-containing protein [Candidatus Eisenbacteria bacterium]
MKRSRVVLISLFSALIGLIVGGWAFSKSQPRSVIAIKSCENCASPADLLGLMASVGIQKTPGMMPLKVLETDKTIAFKLPRRKGFHYVIVPRIDIKDVGDVSPENAEYLSDAFLVMRRLIDDNRLTHYAVTTNGPGFQSVTYLHFHLSSDGS